MIRIILGVIVGFLAWTILWIGGGEVISMISPNWYGAHEIAFEKAVFNKTPFEANSAILVIYVIRIVITSLISGFLAAIVANESRWTTLALGILLVITGSLFQMMAWSLLPNWYHFLSLVLLIPVTIAGGRLRKFSK